MSIPKNRMLTYSFAVATIGLFFFIFGFITWINGVLIPFLRITCELNESQSYFVTFAFYISYTVISLPCVYILKKTGMINGMRLGLLIMALGSLTFIPAASERSFIIFLAGLFATGAGLTILQVAVNPYVTLLGPQESAAKRISIMGLCNKFAGVIAPLIIGSILLKKSNVVGIEGLNSLPVLEKNHRLDTLGQSIVGPYLIIAIILAVLCVLLKYAKLPDIKLPGDAGSASVGRYWKQILAGSFAIFCSVGVEVISGDTISNYGIYHGLSLSTAKNLTSVTLVAMLIGYLTGVVCIPRYFSQERAFLVCSIAGLLISFLVILVPGKLSIIFLALSGVANSMLWPAIWPRALNGLNNAQVNKVSAILIMGIAGGAILPLAYGYLAEIIGNRYAYIALIPCYLFNLLYAIVPYQNTDISRYSPIAE